MNVKFLIPFVLVFLYSTISFAQTKGKSNNSTNKKTSTTVIIGTQTWMSENLNTSTFKNGDIIPQAKTAEEWKKAGEQQKPAWCYYNNDPKNELKYGKLYNWYAVNDARGLAPNGWHIPSNDEWTLLETFLGDWKKSGNKLKAIRDWLSNGNGSNETGFSGVPGGYRLDNGEFYGIGEDGQWWSSTDQFQLTETTAVAWYRSLSNRNTYLNKDWKRQPIGLSVRCIKDK